MNRKRREFLAALAPAVDFAMRAKPDPAREIPGLALHARTSAEMPAELMIYGPIGMGGFFEEGIMAADVATLLRQAGPGPVNVRINSPGGDVFQGTAIYDLLSRHPGLVTVDVDGLAASAASFIMLAGDLIRAPKHAFVMVHDAMTGPYGNEATLRSAADILGKVSATMAEMYADRAGEDAEYWRNVMTANGEDGTWYTGQEALDAGLVDEITTGKGEDDDEDVAARLSGWSAFLPKKIAAAIKLPADPAEDTTPTWDVAQFQTLMKGVLA